MHPGQQTVIDQAERFNVLECGRRFGKTTLGEYLGIRTALDGDPAAWFAPTYKLLYDVWRETQRLTKPVTARADQQEKRLQLITGGTIDFWSLDQPDAGRGRKYKRLIVDEGGIVRLLDQAWQEALRPTLADLKGDAWFLGTPKGNNFFHRLFTKGQQREPGWRSWRLPTTSNPNIDPTEIEAARRDMPEQAFAQEFLGIPADVGGNPFDLSAIRDCTVAHLSAAPPVAFGVDLAKSHDYTVACGLDADGRVSVLERWQSDWDQTRRRILDLIGDLPALIDSTGVGDPIVEDLHRYSWAVEGFKFTQTSKQQLMEGLAAGIQRRELRFPAGWLTAELEAFEYQISAGGTVKYSAPQGLHDDGVMALALARQQLYGNPWRGTPMMAEGGTTVSETSGNGSFTW